MRQDETEGEKVSPHSRRVRMESIHALPAALPGSTGARCWGGRLGTSWTPLRLSTRARRACRACLYVTLNEAPREAQAHLDAAQETTLTFQIRTCAARAGQSSRTGEWACCIGELDGTRERMTRDRPRERCYTARSDAHRGSAAGALSTRRGSTARGIRRGCLPRWCRRALDATRACTVLQSTRSLSNAEPHCYYCTHPALALRYDSAPAQIWSIVGCDHMMTHHMVTPNNIIDEMIYADAPRTGSD